MPEGKAERGSCTLSTAMIRSELEGERSRRSITTTNAAVDVHSRGGMTDMLSPIVGEHPTLEVDLTASNGLFSQHVAEDGAERTTTIKAVASFSGSGSCHHCGDTDTSTDETEGESFEEFVHDCLFWLFV